MTDAVRREPVPVPPSRPSEADESHARGLQRMIERNERLRVEAAGAKARQHVADRNRAEAERRRGVKPERGRS